MSVGDGGAPPGDSNPEPMDEEPRRVSVTVVRPLGFEPRTNGLRVHCSAVELEAHRSGSGRAVYGAHERPGHHRTDWGERGDLNPRPPGPQPGALTELSYAHHGTRQSATSAVAGRHHAMRAPQAGRRLVSAGRVPFGPPSPAVRKGK